MKRTQSEDDFYRLMQFKWVLVVLDILVLCTSVACFGICLWIRFDLDFREWVREMDWYSYWYCMYVVMIGMLIVMFTTLFHAYGVLTEGLSTLGLCQFFYVVAIIFEFTGATVILVYGIEESTVLVDQLKEVFFELIYRMDYDPRANRILKIVQEYVGCCGANGSEDYIAAYKPVPMECRDMVTGREYAYGCGQQFAWYLEPWSCCLAGICIGLILFHVAQLIFTSSVKKNIRRYNRAYDYDYEYDE